MFLDSTCLFMVGNKTVRWECFVQVLGTEQSHPTLEVLMVSG